MPKRMFWPVAMLVVGLILIATKMDLLPAQLWNLWPIVLIVVGLAGLLVSDKEEWDVKTNTTKQVAQKSAPKTTAAKKTVKKTAAKKKTSKR